MFAYYCEFVTQAERGRQLSWLLVFWAIGGVFTALMAWIIIPRTGWWLACYWRYKKVISQRFLMPLFTKLEY